MTASTDPLVVTITVHPNQQLEVACSHKVSPLIIARLLVVAALAGLDHHIQTAAGQANAPQDIVVPKIIIPSNPNKRGKH